MRVSDEPWDAIVIGAGPSGVLATERLRMGGQRVLLLEAGGRDGKRGERTADDDARWRYSCVGARAEWWRAHGVGGNTLLWGGWANRFPDEVLRGGGFPFGAADVAADYATAERWLGVEQGRLDLRYRRAARELDVRVLPRRNARLGTRTWTARHPPSARTARTHTTALRLIASSPPALAQRGQTADVTAVEVVGPRGLERLRARAFVLALSPVETFRLLVTSGFEHAELGRSLCDHVVVHMLLIEPRAEVPLGARGRFPGSAFAPSAAAPFCVEMIGPWRLSSADRAMLAGAGVRPPRGASITRINAMGALTVHPERFLALAPRARDALGRAVPRVHFAWSAADRRLVTQMVEACATFAEAIAGPGAQLVQHESPLVAPALFHPSGTCRMGLDTSAPCDPHGRLRAARNVWVADASVFPSPGDRHPTLTLLAHTLRATTSITRALTASLRDA